MDLLEFQGKLLVAAAGVPRPRGRAARSPQEARQAAGAVGYPVTVKPQALACGHDVAGEAQIVAGPEEIEAVAERVLALRSGAHPVHSLLIEEVVDVRQQFTVAVMLDQRAARPLLLLASQGGAEAEELLRTQPEQLTLVHLDPLLVPFAAVRDAAWSAIADMVSDAGLGVAFRDDMLDVVASVYGVYRDADATLVEVNPLAVVAGRDGRGEELLALDVRVSIDDNAMFRHGELSGWRVDTDDRERRAREAGTTLVTLDGDIGVIANGAGLVMSTVDLVTDAGGAAAGGCDIGGAQRVQTAAAIRLLASDPRVKALVVNVFASVVPADEIAEGLLEGLDELPESELLPVTVRLEGDGAEAGREALRAAARPELHIVDRPFDAVRLAVELAARVVPRPEPIMLDASAEPVPARPDRSDSLDLDELLPAVKPED